MFVGLARTRRAFLGAVAAALFTGTAGFAQTDALLCRGPGRSLMDANWSHRNFGKGFEIAETAGRIGKSFRRAETANR
jgi:hypothetical protein